MRIRLRKLLKICGFVACGAVLVLAGAVVLVLIDKPLVKNIVQKYVARKAGISLTVGKLDYRLFPLRIEATSVKASYATSIFTVSIAAGRVEVHGDLKKLLKGERPAFESVEAEIAEIRLDQKEISPEPIDFRGIILETSDILGYSTRWAMRCGRLIVLLPSQDIRADNLGLAVSKSERGGTYEVKLECESCGGAMNNGSLAFGGGLRAGGTVSLGRTLGFDLSLALAKPQISSAGRTAAVGNLTVVVEGAWQSDSGRFSLSNLALDIPGLANLKGTLAADPRGNPPLVAEAQVWTENLESLATLVKPFLPPELRAVRVQGKAGLEGKYSLPSGQGRVPGTFTASMEMDRVRWEYNGASFPFRGEVSGTLRAAGSLTDPRGSGDIRLSLGKLSAHRACVLESSAHLRFKGSKTSAELSILSGSLRGISLPVSSQRNIEFQEIGLGGNVGARFGRDKAVQANIEARLPKLAPIRLAIVFGLAPLWTRQAGLVSRGQSISAIRGLLSPFLPAKLGPWNFDGTVDFTVDTDSGSPGQGPLAFSGEVSLSRGKFNDPDFIVAGDNIQSLVRVRGSYDLTTGGLTWTGTMDLPRGESLWKRLYISWNKFPLGAEIAGRYDRAAGSLEDLAVKVNARSLGEVRAAGRLGLVAPMAFDLHAGARLSLEAASSLLSGAGPSPQGGPQIRGEAAGDFDVRNARGGLSLSGRLTLGDVSIDNPASGVSIRGLDAEIPVDLSLAETPGAEPAPVQSAQGTIRVAEVKTPAMTLQPPPLAISCRRNACEIAPFSLDVFGGRLEFGRISLSIRPAPLSLAGEASLKLPDLDISRLPFVSAKFPLTGRARADFPTLAITQKKIQASGQAEAEIFGGRVIVRNLSLVDPFSADREISCDVDLLDLDLKKITDLVPFGEVTGIIRGEVRNLVIAYGQPEQFNLSLESVKRKGVAQTFSLKAVNSLTVIAAGQGATEGSGSFWLRFIRGFRYEKIGILSTLKNDTFTIDGTIRENGMEYLVKRPRLFGISVINRMPGKTIGFKDMMSRLNRVGQSSPPVIK